VKCPASEVIGSIGVALLLIAFFVNSFGMLASDSRPYQAMNVVGAALSCYASYRIGFAPVRGARSDLVRSRSSRDVCASVRSDKKREHRGGCSRLF